MAQYIDKAVVVAEIERRLKFIEIRLERNNSYTEEGNTAWKRDKALYDAHNFLLSFLDTLEVKEVDFDREIRRYRMNNPIIGHREESLYDYMASVAKHFFELGLKARIDKELVDEVYSHIDSIKDTADRMTSGNFMHNRAAIKFSANTIAKVLELIGLKVAQKGEEYE